MRVISGTARGCKLQSVEGMNTRPTTDRVKESVFNIIQMHISDAVVLDLFAGTGQLGIETLSRGAKHCDFVDINKKAQNTIKNNLATARVQDKAKIHKMQAEEFLKRTQGTKYDIILLDPPYGGKILDDTLFMLNQFDILSPSGIILCESAVGDQISSPYKMGKEYRYGATKINLLYHNGSIDD